MIVWVFGGTCVGKKRFIERAANPQTRPEYFAAFDMHAEWIEDGPLTVDIVTRALEHEDLILRWQWGRDETLESICQNHPEIKHTIVMLSVNLMTQLSRIALREGCLKWDAGQIHGEQVGIFERVHELSEKYRIPVLHVDASNDDYRLRKSVAA